MSERKRVYYYARVSSSQQTTDGQKQQLEQEMVKDDRYTVYCQDVGSGKRMKHPSYQKIKKDIEHGLVYEVVVCSINRLGRNLYEMIGFLELCRDHGVNIKSIREGITDSSGFTMKMLIVVLGLVAEWENEQRSEATRQGQQARWKKKKAEAEKNGTEFKRYRRPRKVRMHRVTETMFDTIIFLRHQQGKSMRSIARAVGVSDYCVKRVLEKAKTVPKSDWIFAKEKCRG